ncbi:MAG: PAS domain S-box protein [Desulfuromonadales bacterium]|nr:PAS domain S-box protein [Desulfuromonadales bacterium]
MSANRLHARIKYDSGEECNQSLNDPKDDFFHSQSSSCGPHCLAIAGYTGFLLFSQYRSQSELETFYLNSQLQDSDKNATALGYFFSERSDDIVRLADSRELSLYFENKALGMSMEYGLSASLLDAEDAFKKFREKRKLDNKAIYSRIVFLDASGRKLIETGEPSKSDSPPTRENITAYVVKQTKSPLIFAKGSAEDSLITLSIPFEFKGNYSGQIIAQIPLAMVYRQFVHQSKATSIQQLRVLLYQQKYLYSPPQNSWKVSPESMQLPNRFENNRPYRFSVADKNGALHTVKAFATPVKGTPFSLATIIQNSKRTPSTSPKLWFIVTGSIGLIILTGAAIIIRTTLRNEVLKARLNEISIREKTIAEKNRSLIKLTTAVEQSANAVIITGTDGVIEYVNPYFTQLTDIPYEEAVGSGLDIIEPESESVEEFHKLLQSIGAGRHWSGELLNRSKGGERMYWANITVAPVKNEVGDVLSCVAIAQDITARKDTEEQIIHMNIELEQRVKERTAALEASHRERGKAYDIVKKHGGEILVESELGKGTTFTIELPFNSQIQHLTS